MSKNYAVRLCCPYGDHDAWVTLENKAETFDQVMRASWDFECPVHGVQREIPLEVSEKASVNSPFAPLPQAPPGPEQPRGQQWGKPAEPKDKKENQRSSERKPLHVPVVIYGWTQGQGGFQEETSTLLVNDTGALVVLKAKVQIGEAIFLINKNTREEQEIRVVYAEAAVDDRTFVGVAFKRPSLGFWKKSRKNPRIPEKIRVIVKGKDHNGNPFVQSSYTIDISQSGARLEGLGYLAGVGETIEVKRRWRGKARFRVVWAGQVGMGQSNQIGICSLEDDKNIWGVKLPEEGNTANAAKPPKKKSFS